MGKQPRGLGNAKADPPSGLWGFLGSGISFFMEVLRAVAKDPLLSILWGICVLFLFLVVATFALGGELPGVGRLALVAFVVIVMASLFAFTAWRMSPAAPVSPADPGEQRLLNTTADTLQALHDLETAIRAAIGPLTRFDPPRCDPSERKEIIQKMDCLADTEVVLPKVRQLVPQLDRQSHEFPGAMRGETRAAVEVVLACGKRTLALVGPSQVTPWGGARELAMLRAAIHDAASPEQAEAIRLRAKKLVEVVDRESLQTADDLLGRARGAQYEQG
jgi:hypothetical protein